MWGKIVDILKLELYDKKSGKDYHFRLHVFTEEDGKNLCVDVTCLKLNQIFQNELKVYGSKLYGLRYIRLDQHVSENGRIYYTLAHPRLYKGYIRTVGELLAL